MADYTNAELANVHLAYWATDYSGPTAHRLYAKRYPTRRIPSHNFFASLEHQKLAETGSFQRAGRVRITRTPTIEQNVLQEVQGTLSMSTRSLAVL